VTSDILVSVKTQHKHLIFKNNSWHSHSA